MSTHTRWFWLSTLAIGLFSFAGCNLTVEVYPDGSDNTQVGSAPPGGETPTDGTPQTPAPTPATTPDAAGNPDSPCADQTNIYVSYVNRSSARVGFVESFRDQANQSLAASIYVLEAAGHSKDTRHKCITCPYQAGIRNVKYIRDGNQTAVPYPADLFSGAFRCGDHITFTFHENGSISTSVETP